MFSTTLHRLPQAKATTKITSCLRQATITTPRSFSTSFVMSAPNKEWLVTIPDKPNALQQRLSVRPLHLEKINPLVEVGQIVLGGATLTEHPPVDGTPDMTGSVMIFKAETEQEVRSLLENDIYTKEGVWDLSKVKIVPFKSAIRKGL